MKRVRVERDRNAVSNDSSLPDAACSGATDDQVMKEHTLRVLSILGHGHTTSAGVRQNLESEKKLDPKPSHAFQSLFNANRRSISRHPKTENVAMKLFSPVSKAQ